MLFCGCDTETYYETINNITYKGLKSIQLVTDNEELYFTGDDYTVSDDELRCNICEKFFKFLFNTNDDLRIAFFNMTFDVSQFLKYMVS